MGLLDEAIREHLELKRRRGTDPREIARLEKEALGPVDREAYREEARAAATAPDEAAPPLDEAELPYEEPVAAEADDELEYEVDLPDEDDLGWDEDDADATRVVDPPPAAEAPPSAEIAAPQDAPSPEPPPSAEAPPSGIDQPTAAYSLDDLEDLEDRPRSEPRDVVPADDEPGEGDVLEETPDFLEETPEHDRLWFEQKPPRDFDF